MNLPFACYDGGHMMEDFLKSSRNPNLKPGKIKDVGSDFEAEILTEKDDLADRDGQKTGGQE